MKCRSFSVLGLLLSGLAELALGQDIETESSPLNRQSAEGMRPVSAEQEQSLTIWAEEYLDREFDVPVKAYRFVSLNTQSFVNAQLNDNIVIDMDGTPRIFTTTLRRERGSGNGVIWYGHAEGNEYEIMFLHVSYDGTASGTLNGGERGRWNVLSTPQPPNHIVIQQDYEGRPVD